MNAAKHIALLWCGTAYAVAIAAAVGAGYLVRDAHPLVVIAVADVVGTAAVFAFSRAFNNSSFYDPYWSIAPMVIVLYWAIDAPVPLRAAIVVVLVWAWGARLTYNFFKGWPGLHHEDWRYVNLRTKNGRAYWLVSFFGIHLAPTVWVYLGCLALYPALSSTTPLRHFDVLGIGLTAGAIVLEATADRQLWQFRKHNPAPGAILRTGLWRNSRHPNYLGEILFWWGLCFIGVAANPSMVWVVAGPLSITALFVFISIPMIDKRHLERRPAYAEHMQRVPALFPIGHKRHWNDPNRWRQAALTEEVTATLDATPALAPYLAELLADLDELGSSAQTVGDLLAPLDLDPSHTRVLDLGCGKGANTIALAQRFGFHALGVDGFAPFVEHASESAQRSGLGSLCTFRQGDLRDALSPNPPYDVVVLAAVGRVLGDMRTTMEHLRRAVRPGGYIVIDDCYLAEGHAIGKERYQEYMPRDETLSALEALGDKVLKEVVASPDSVKAGNLENTRLIRARAEAMAKKHPQDAAALMAFVSEQEEECNILETDLVCATWLIQRGSD